MSKLERVGWRVLLSATALCLVAMLTGCAYVRAYDKTRDAGFQTVVPAWPWQDSNRVVEKMNISSRSNAFTASIRGLSETETTSTNAVDLISKVTEAAVGAAVKAAVKP